MSQQAIVKPSQQSPVRGSSSGRSLGLLDPKSDLVFKKIFGNHPSLTKSFLNGVLRLPPDRLIENLVYLTPEQAPRIPSMKNTIVDVKCTDQKGNIFIVEMQMTWSASFFKRFLFGASKAYVQQLDSGKTYDTLCPVYGLAIINEVFEASTAEWYHHYRLTHTQDREKALEGIELVLCELPKFRPETWSERKLGALWLRFLQEVPTLEAIPVEFQENPDLSQALALVQESAYTKEELAYYDQYLDAVRVAGTIQADARNEGLAKGFAEGKAEGEKRLLEEKIAIAKKLLASGMSVEAVSDVTGFSQKEIRELEGVVSSAY
ncbi:MAG: Rpn family recombination-promoting nuclease/putative transposase [Alphaproteobacteria bacterium]